MELNSFESDTGVILEDLLLVILAKLRAEQSDCQTIHNSFSSQTVWLMFSVYGK